MVPRELYTQGKTGTMLEYLKSMFSLKKIKVKSNEENETIVSAVVHKDIDYMLEKLSHARTICVNKTEVKLEDCFSEEPFKNTKLYDFNMIFDDHTIRVHVKYSKHDVPFDYVIKTLEGNGRAPYVG